MRSGRRFRVLGMVLAVCLALAVGPGLVTTASADLLGMPSTHELEVLKGQLDALAEQGKAGGAQFWYVDRDTMKLELSVLVTALDPVTAAFLAVANARPELVTVTRIDTPVEPFVGRREAGVQPAAILPAAGTLYGGTKITASNGGYCTSGFNAQNRTTGKAAVLTAGHCTKAGVSNWTAGGSALGNITDYNYPRADWSSITPVDGWSLPAAVQTANGVQQISAWSTPRVGQPVCKVGATSGTTCGRVTAINVTVNYGDGAIYGLAQTNVLAKEGDSGGSVYDSSTAVALISGGPKGGGNAFVQPLNF
ncbi:MAG TPA: S1 family peptidase [Acidimicrobiales bacterium]|nr:S1 family peptidase [Acidimicrobiales bacterium]